MNCQTKPTATLFVITQGVWGGAQRYVYDLSAKTSQKNPVAIAIGEPNGRGDLQTKLKNNPGRALIQLHYLRRAINPYFDILALFELRSLYKKLQPQTVHLNSSKAGIIGSIAAIGLKNRPQIIYTVHGWVFNEPLNFITKKIYFILEKLTARLKDTVIVLSPEEKIIAEKLLKIPTSKIRLIPHNISPPEFLTKEIARARILKMTQIEQTPKFFIGTIANLYQTKGIDILISAAKLVANQKPDATFFVIGSGPEELNLKKIIATLDLHNIHLLGAYDNAAELLPAFDLFVLPSRKEGLPYTVLEAISAQLPIIATAVGGLPGLAQKYPQLKLVPPLEPTVLANAIIKKLIT